MPNSAADRVRLRVSFSHTQIKFNCATFKINFPALIPLYKILKAFEEEFCTTRRLKNIFSSLIGLNLVTAFLSFYLTYRVWEKEERKYCVHCSYVYIFMSISFLFRRNNWWIFKHILVTRHAFKCISKFPRCAIKIFQSLSTLVPYKPSCL